MKIYDKMGKEHKTVDEALAAEKEYDEKVAAEQKKKEELAASRKARASEVENAYKAILAFDKECKEKRATLVKEYNEKLKAFTKDFGNFHMTIKTGDGNPFDMFDIFNRFWF